MCIILQACKRPDIGEARRDFERRRRTQNSLKGRPNTYVYIYMYIHVYMYVVSVSTYNTYTSICIYICIYIYVLLYIFFNIDIDEGLEVQGSFKEFRRAESMEGL